MSLIKENNRQYYEGAQSFRGDGSLTSFKTTFNTDIKWYSSDPNSAKYANNNFKLYTSTTGLPGDWTEVVSGYSVSDNTIVFDIAPALNSFIVVQLKTKNGGNYGSNFNDRAFGRAVEDNYGSYSFVKLNDIVNNFIVAYVGDGKLITSVNRTDIVFHAKRAVQELSYDTFNSVKSQELTIPNSLSVVIPQDYVNYVNIYWVDNQGVKHIIMPTKLTSNPSETPLQDGSGVPIQDQDGNNIETKSITEERWKENDLKDRKDYIGNSEFSWDYYYGDNSYGNGQVYGLDPQHANINGYFTINHRDGVFSFSSDLVDKIIILEYISDGLSTDLNTVIPKMAEEAMYAYISHAIIASKINQPEYIVNRLKKEKSAKLRNAKIRLSNLKLNEIVQVMRGKSKWIKH